MTPGKAPWLRIFLVWGAFLLLQTVSGNPGSVTGYRYDETCRLACGAIFDLRFVEAAELLRRERVSDPGNLVPVYLENYIDFLSLMIGEQRAEYEQWRDRRQDRIKVLEKGPEGSPMHRFCLGQVYLQWAVVRLKFGDYTSAVLDLRRAYSAFEENDRLYPTFLINRTGLGVLHVIISMIPEKYRWIGSVAGLHGTMEKGIAEIRQVADYSGPDPVTRIYRAEAGFFMAFLGTNLRSNKGEAVSALAALSEDPSPAGSCTSPLLLFAKVAVLMKNGRNDEALAALSARKPCAGSYSFLYLDFLEGLARLDRLDFSAAANFRGFTTGFKGFNYQAAARQKLAWIALLQGDSAGYRQQMASILALPSSGVDEDRQAIREARSGTPPNPHLLRARLLFDGGYYERAERELLDYPVGSTVRSKRDLLEYSYRLGRICHEKGDFNRAIDNYRLTISRGSGEPWYFAAGAAYQMGLLYENSGKPDEAAKAYRLCLTIETPEYKNSLREKAKAGLNRLNGARPKT